MLSEKKVYPLSSSEMGIYLDHPETTAYNLPYFLQLDKDVDIKRLKDALSRLLDIHQHAYMRIMVDDEGNVGKYLEKCEFDLPTVNANSLDDYEAQPFIITDAPLFRFSIYEIKGAKYLLFEFHHLVIDGTGVDVFVKDLLDLYDGKDVKGETCTAEEYSEKELAARQSKQYADGKEYYEKTFGGIECSSALPFDKSDGQIIYKRISGKLSIKNSEVNKFVKSKKVKTSAFFLSVYAYLLAKMNMEKEALVATVHNGRDESIKNSIGMFVKTLPFYTQFGADTSVEDYLVNNNSQLVESINYDIYSFVDVTRDLGLSIEQFFGYQGDMYRYERKGEALGLYSP